MAAWATWPELPETETWLRALVQLAEDEARDRYDDYVDDEHLALAITRAESGSHEMLAALGVHVRIWRDHIVNTMGFNEALAFVETGELGARGARALRRERPGPIQVAPAASLVLDRAITEAARAGQVVGPAHVVIGMLQVGGIGGGTASREGMTLAQVRGWAGIDHPRRVLAVDPAHPARRPQRAGPLVLLGGGETVEVYTSLLELVPRSAADGPTVVAVFAGYPDLPPAYRQRTLDAFRQAGAARVLDSGLDTRADAAKPSALAALAAADVIYLSGGWPVDIFDTLWATPAYEALVDAADRGAVVAGSSAGAAVLGRGTMTDRLSGSEEERVDLFGWVDAVVWPHFRADDLPRMREWQPHFPGVDIVATPHLGAVIGERSWASWRTLRPGVAGVAGTILRPDGEVVPLAAADGS